MRVLHLDTGHEMRGGQWQVLSLLNGLGTGHVLLAASNSPLMEAARSAGIDVQTLSLVTLARHARASDLVHAHDARSHTWAAALGTGRLIVSRRVAFPIGQSVMSRWKYARPLRYLAVSEHVKHTLMAGDVPEERITVVYDGVAVPENISTGQRIIAPATDDAAKGSDLVREAANLTGTPIDFSTNLEADLPGAALLVYITRSEGLGSAALLAMAHGVPVVASRVGGLPEIVREDVCGFLTENHPASIAAAIGRALTHRERLGRDARRCVEERFTVQRMVDDSRRVYEQVLEC